MTLFERKEFTSHSGLPLTWKLECDALSDEDISTLAFIISQNFRFSKVIGVPRGGLRLARALEPYVKEDSIITLIVDDVLTTGNSMEAVRQGITNICSGVVIFSRIKSYPAWIHPLFVLQTGN